MINILFYYSTVVPYICMVSVLHSSQLPCRILDKFDAIICKTQRIILSCNTTMVCEWNSEQFHMKRLIDVKSLSLTSFYFWCLESRWIMTHYLMKCLPPIPLITTNVHYIIIYAAWYFFVHISAIIMEVNQFTSVMATSYPGDGVVEELV